MDKKLTPLELARQTLIQLSKSQSPPTPENYRRVYDEIAGSRSVDQAEVLNKSLEKVLNELGKDKPKYSAASQKIATLVKKQDSANLEDLLRKLIPTGTSEADGVNWGALLRYLFKQLDVNHTGVTSSRKKEALNRVIINFANDPNQLGQKIQALVTSWGTGQSTIQTNAATPVIETEAAELASPLPVSHSQTQVTIQDNNQQALALAWRNLLIRTINLVVLPQFADIPAAAEKIEFVVKQAQAATTIDHVNALSDTLKSFILRAEMRNDAQHRMQESLVQMLRLLISSMGELTIEDKWLHGQISIVQEIISKPLDIDAVYNAESSLKELIYKQSNIKPGLIAAKDTLKGMMSSFVSGLADITKSTGAYQAKINSYQDQITATEDITQLNNILQSLVGDIRDMRADAQNSHNAFEETQKKVEEAEKQINEPVSYTHLDVYKRQVLMQCLWLCANCLV